MTTVFNSCEMAIEFSLRLFGLLRQHGILLGTLQTIACTKSIQLLQSVDERELLTIYRTTLVNRKEDLFHLERLYALLLEAYLSPSTHDGNELEVLENQPTLTIKRQVSAGESDPSDDTEELSEIDGYSVQEVDHHKDFRLIPEQEFPAVLAALERIANKHAAIARRKSKRTKHGRTLDLRSSMREIAKFDGEVVQWRFKRKVPTRTRLVIVVDVSGSMEIYSTFLLNFLHFLHKNRNFKIEIFVFSTELVPLTKYFRLRNFQATLDSMSLHFSGWSGGTKIGQAIATLNETYAAVVTPKSVVIIMSDGWDTGDVAVLDRAMATLSSRAKAITWINPLKGDPSYEPLTQGMATARPYCDEFVSGHSIESLERFVDLIGR